MRATAALPLGPDDNPDVLPLAPADVDTLTAALRGHLEPITPKVEEGAGKLSARPGSGEYGAGAYARRPARVLKGLCAHHETLGEV
ncbi:DUF6415 family natural product biosynthesis protein [Streptomyces shenzhenensis]|uniref:DUF6415 family natural product biosynthesis protein n=1 Tax=Streptomyces shenzhenensis TaxID=943815 RepID=UPI003694F370